MVVDADLDVQGQQVTVTAGDGPFLCPECQTGVPGYDKKPRRWPHLDTCQLTTWIVADVPRVECLTHGAKQIRVPWAEPGDQFTALFERFAIDVLRQCSVQGGADLVRMNCDEAWGTKARALARGLPRLGQEVVAHLGLGSSIAEPRSARHLTAGTSGPARSRNSGSNITCAAVMARGSHRTCSMTTTTTR